MKQCPYLVVSKDYFRQMCALKLRQKHIFQCRLLLQNSSRVLIAKLFSKYKLRESIKP